ncbi:hypothetical protein [Actinacidiphila epipremni]|jgi:hypothetical protein|uniref:Secreted protein n=1 Tax=Actinacidiphila epipremni TaxID=2053013 RepID=A0ABX0ZT23_9ACTN|nr:hypothetical protein [Actinacidiphila epipremni]NJP46140.1 hypothetical protein [Actinacidiphila epipremni]
MRTRFLTRAATAAAGAVLALGIATATAQASPPPGSGFMFMGYYPTYDSCVAAAQANAPIHGPVYICEYGTNNLYLLWMH